MSRLFLAVRPDDQIQAELEQLDRNPAPGVRWVPPGQRHITLRFWPKADPAAVIEAIDELAVNRWNGLGPVTVTLGPVVSRLGRDTVVLPASGLDELAVAVRAATSEIPPRPQRPFVGHLTLARLKHRAACGVAGARFSASFTPSDVELVESELRPTGARHRVITSWPIATI